MELLKINNLKKTYSSGKRAVDGLDITIEEGDIFGFIGHNGAGKTTTIRCAVGVLSFEEGEIHVNGISLKDDPVACKRIMAYIPDNPDLYEHMTGEGYLQFIGDIYAVPSNERMERIEKYAQMLELKDSLGGMIASYSHGMKQKLAIISALIHQPKLMVMDEPFVGLDPKAAFTVKSIMHEMCKGGSAIFFSTHVLEVAEKLCNKVAIIKDGKIAAMGRTEEVTGDGSLEDLFMELADHG